VLSAEHHLRHIEARLLASGGVPIRGGSLLIYPGDLFGSLDVDLEFLSGHRLSVFLAIDVSYGYPLWATYALHLMDDAGHCVVRYDNAPHHPELATFPDHKHLGPSELPAAHPRPSLSAFLAEVERLVE
jgi:hypothetical protein